MTVGQFSVASPGACVGFWWGQRPSPPNVARTERSDKAFRPKKPCRKAVISGVQITFLQYVLLQLRDVIAGSCDHSCAEDARTTRRSVFRSGASRYSVLAYMPVLRPARLWGWGCPGTLRLRLVFSQ